MSIGLAALLAQTASGECPFCGEPRKPKKNAKGTAKLDDEGGAFFATCGAEECRKTAYQRLYKRDLRRRQTTAGPKVAVCNTRPSTVISDLGSSDPGPAGG